MDNNNKIQAIMYAKFNNRDKRGAILYADKQGVAVIDTPFKELLKEVAMDDSINDTINANVISNEEDEMELTLMCQAAIHENKLRIQRGEK